MKSKRLILRLLIYGREMFCYQNATPSYQKRALIYQLLQKFSNAYFILIEYDNDEWFQSESKAAVELLHTNTDFLLQ